MVDLFKRDEVTHFSTRLSLNVHKKNVFPQFGEIVVIFDNLSSLYWG